MWDKSTSFKKVRKGIVNFMNKVIKQMTPIIQQI